MDPKQTPTAPRSLSKMLRRAMSKLRRDARTSRPSSSRVSKHRLRRVWPDGTVVEWNATSTPPWVKRSKNRRRNQEARQSRRINRRNAR